MQKGKFGIYLWFYAMLAFVLAFLGQVLLAGLLLGFVIVAEKDEWVIKQVMQAFGLAIFASVVGEVLDIINVFGSVPFIGSLFNTVFNVIETLVAILILVFCIIGIVRVCKGQDAGVPAFNRLANRAFGLIQQKVYTQNPQNPNGNIPPQQ